MCEGHLPGGPFAFHAALAAALLVSACAAPRPAGPPAPVEPAARPADVYRTLGLHTGPAHFPAVVDIGALAGPADSTFVVLALSLPNAALRFRREADGFIAEYSVDATFIRDGEPVGGLTRREVVRVGTFAETSRADESVVFQAFVPLAPGRYTLRLRAADGQGSRALEFSDSIDVSAFGPAGAPIAAPLVVYDGVPRHTRAGRPQLIINPRRTVQFGDPRARLYLEAYDPALAPVRVRLLDEAGTTLWTERVAFGEPGAGDVRAVVVDVPGDALPLGRLTIEVTTLDGVAVRSPLVLTISDQWLASNFDELIEFVRYIAAVEELDSLVTGPPAERRARWDAFWARREPAGEAAGGHTFRDEFFRRIRYAAEHYAEFGRPGWQTHRGEVYIVLGAPDYGYDRYVTRLDAGVQPNAIEWLYENTAVGRLQLMFVDRGGFGRYELTSASMAAFRAAADRTRTATRENQHP